MGWVSWFVVEVGNIKWSLFVWKLEGQVVVVNVT